MTTSAQVKTLVALMLFGAIFISFWMGLIYGGGEIPTLWTLAALGVFHALTMFSAGCRAIWKYLNDPPQKRVSRRDGR